MAACSSNPFELTEASYSEHRSIWQASGLGDYSFAYNEVCECPPVLSRPNLVEVRSGRVWRVTLTDTEQIVDEQTEALFPSVNDLFDRIDAAIRQEAASIQVSYDPTLGYPTEITIDWNPMAVDDETKITVTDLVEAG